MITSMIKLTLLQDYWWVLISVLGAILVFMLFVQGGQTMLLGRLNADDRSRMVSSLGHKWELTFTTLVVFGGAFFASFPLFYSTSFGGAYWLWMLILFSFIIQAVSYEFRSKPGNIFGRRTYDTFLFINGCVGCILLGVAVAMFFFGGEFTVGMGNILDPGAPVISCWAPTHGFEAIFNWRNLVLGFTVLFLARTLAALYFINNIPAKPDSEFRCRARFQVTVNGAIFVVLFLVFVFLLLTAKGMAYDDQGCFEWVENKYLQNYLALRPALLALLIGTLLVLYAYLRTITQARYVRGIWPAGIGTVLVVLSLFWVAGFNSTAYLPSLVDAASSLTIRNSSSTQFTLQVMSIVSLIIPFVVAYIAYVWHSMDRH